MKKYTRVKYVGEAVISFGAHGELTPGSEFSLDFREVKYLEESNDGWPEYLEKVEGGESDVKEPKKFVIADDLEGLDVKGLVKVAKVEEINLDKVDKKDRIAVISVVRGTRKARAEEIAAHKQPVVDTPIDMDTVMTPDTMFKTAPEGEPKEPVVEELPPYEEWKMSELKEELEAREIKLEGRYSNAKAAEALNANDAAEAGE